MVGEEGRRAEGDGGGCSGDSTAGERHSAAVLALERAGELSRWLLWSSSFCSSAMMCCWWRRTNKERTARSLRQGGRARQVSVSESSESQRRNCETCSS